jgi:hypothetical protein
VRGKPPGNRGVGWFPGGVPRYGHVVPVPPLSRLPAPSAGAVPDLALGVPLGWG